MSKFDKIFEAREADENIKTNVRVKEKGKESVSKESKANSQNVVKTEKQMLPVAESKIQKTQLQPGKQRGRPPAKRSDPSYIGFTTYIRKDTHLNVKISLLQEGEGRELSELVESLLSKWVAEKHKR